MLQRDEKKLVSGRTEGGVGETQHKKQKMNTCTSAENYGRRKERGEGRGQKPKESAERQRSEEMEVKRVRSRAERGRRKNSTN